MPLGVKAAEGSFGEVKFGGRLNCHVIKLWGGAGSCLPIQFNSEASEAPSFMVVQPYRLRCRHCKRGGDVFVCTTVGNLLILRGHVDLEEAAIFVFVCLCL